MFACTCARSCGCCVQRKACAGGPTGSLVASAAEPMYTHPPLAVPKRAAPAIGKTIVGRRLHISDLWLLPLPLCRCRRSSLNPRGTATALAKGPGAKGLRGKVGSSSRDQVSVHRKREFVVGYAKRTQRAV